MAALKLTTVRRADTSDPPFANDLPVVVFPLYLTFIMLVHEMNNDTFCSLVYHIL